jgi:hypothetical protein
MREIKSFTQSDAPVKVKECLRLFNTLLENKTCKSKMDDLDFSFVKQPLAVKASKFEAGKLLMGMNERNQRIEFDIERAGRDLDRQAQCKMYEQPPIQKWGIFYQERDSATAKDFIMNMEKCISQFGYNAKQMASFIIKGNNIESWRQVLQQKLDQSV